MDGEGDDMEDEVGSERERDQAGKRAEFLGRQLSTPPRPSGSKSHPHLEEGVKQPLELMSAT